MDTNTDVEWLKKTRLCEEVPGVPDDEKYYLWHDQKTVWKGSSRAAGYEWAASNGITIELFEPFEP